MQPSLDGDPRVIAAIEVLRQRRASRWAHAIEHAFKAWVVGLGGSKYNAELNRRAVEAWLELTKEKLPLKSVLPWLRRRSSSSVQMARSLQGQAAYLWLEHWIQSGRATPGQIVSLLHDPSPDLRITMLYVAPSAGKVPDAVRDARVALMADPDPWVSGKARAFYTQVPAPASGRPRASETVRARPAPGAMASFVRLLNRNDISADARAAAETAVRRRGYRVVGHPGTWSVEPIRGWTGAKREPQP